MAHHDYDSASFSASNGSSTHSWRDLCDGDRREGGERLARLARLAADRALGIVAELGDAGSVAAHRHRGQRRGRRLAEQAAAHLVGDLGDAAVVVEPSRRSSPDRRTSGLSRRADLVGAASLPAPVFALASATMRVLVELVAHRKVGAACCTPVSSASMSVLSL